MLTPTKHNSFLLGFKLKKRAGKPGQVFDKALLARSLLPGLPIHRCGVINIFILQGQRCRHRQPHLDDPNGHGDDDQHMYQCHKREYRKKSALFYPNLGKPVGVQRYSRFTGNQK